MRSTIVDVAGPVHLLAEGTAGPALVLVHGLQAPAAGWTEVLAGLGPDHRVVACDLPGFGRTPVDRRRTSLSAHAALVAEIARRTAGDGPAVLVGNSMGAVVALLAAARHPQTARAVVLLTPALPRTVDEPLDPTFVGLLVAAAIPGMLALEPWRRSLQPPESRVHALLEACYAPHSERPTDETVAALVAAEEARARRDHLRGWSGVTRSLFWWLARPGRFHQVAAEVPAPVTLVEGMQDPILPRPTVRTTLERHPGWAHVPLAGVGHVPQIERPAAVVDTLRTVAAATA